METEQCCLMGAMPPMMVGKYNEIVIQLGWLLFFAPAFPAGPLFCQLNCLISVWDELTQMSEFKRRDKPQGIFNIGIWMRLIEGASFIGFVVSVGIVIVTSKKLNVFSANATYPQLVIMCFLFEHAIFILKGCLSAMIPSIPAFVTTQTQTMPNRVKQCA
jgi:polyferredoxin